MEVRRKCLPTSSGVGRGGECNPTSMETPRTSIEPLPSTTTSAASSKTLWECGVAACCNLVKEHANSVMHLQLWALLHNRACKGKHLQLCVPLHDRARKGKQLQLCGLLHDRACKGKHLQALWSSSQSGLQELASMRAKASSGAGAMWRRRCSSLEFSGDQQPKELLDGVYREHWGWTMGAGACREAVGAEMGLLHGQWLQYLEDQGRAWRRSWLWSLRRQAKDCPTCSSLQGDQRPCEQPDALGCQ